MGFSEQLKKARANLGLTQQQVADLMGITKSTYCGYETGKRQPDVLKIKKLANILNTSGDILLETGFNKTEIKVEPNSQPLSNLKQMEETGDKLITNNLTESKLETIKKIKKMSDNEINAILAFIDSLENVTNAMSGYKDKKEELKN